MDIFVTTREGGEWKRVENVEIWISKSSANGIDNKLGSFSLRLVRIDDIAAIKFPDGVIFYCVLFKKWWKPINWWRHKDPDKSIYMEVK